jgi:hypothetical protein
VDDKQLLEEHALQRARLVGMLLHGTAWRERPNRGTLRRLLVGVILGAIACAAIAAGTFIADQVAAGRLGARPVPPVFGPSQRS